MSNRGRYLRSIGLIVCAVALWSTGGLLIRLITADELTTLFWRSIFAITFIFLYLLLFHSHHQLTLRAILNVGLPGLIVALCFTADAILCIYAFEKTSVANVVIIFATTPLVASLFASVVLHESLSRTTWLAITCTFGGVLWMVTGSAGETSLFGDLLALLAAILFAVPIILLRRFPEINVVKAVFLSACLTALTFAPVALTTKITSDDLYLLLLFGAFEYGGATVLFSIGVKHVPIAQSTLLGLLEIVLAPLWVWWILAETPSTKTVTGGSVVLLTLLIYTIYAIREEVKTSGEPLKKNTQDR